MKNGSNGIFRPRRIIVFGSHPETHGVQAMSGAIIELPEDPYFNLKAIFDACTQQINTHQSMITLKVAFIPPALASQSAEAWEIAEYLHEVHKFLFSESYNIEQEYNLSITWMFEDYSSHWLQIIPTSQIAKYVERLRVVLARIPRLFPDLFGLVWEPRECWQEDRAKDLTQTKSWIEELERKYGL